MAKLQNLLKSRVRAGDITVAELAKSAGCSRQYVHNLLYGYSDGRFPQPTLPLAERLARAVGAQIRLEPPVKKNRKIAQ